jgi:hypothetical protein
MKKEKRIKLKNKSKYDFVDISTEEYREYTFVKYFIFKVKVRLKNPLDLAVSSSGHRVLTGDGISHYIPNGWIHLEWKSKPHAPHFVK